MDFLLSAALRPFDIALLIVALLLVVETALLFMGLSSSIEMDGPSAPAAGDLSPHDFDLAAHADAGGVLDVDPDIFDPDVFDLAPGSAVPAALVSDLIARECAPELPLGRRRWPDRLGIASTPLTIWLSGFLLVFGLTGLAIQFTARELFGSPLWTTVAVLLSMAVALPSMAGLSGFIGRRIPRVETTAISRRSFGRRRGVVITGPAIRGRAGEVRFDDLHGNTHYLHAEPFSDQEQIPQGADVLIVRLRTGELRLISLS